MDAYIKSESSIVSTTDQLGDETINNSCLLPATLTSTAAETIPFTGTTFTDSSSIYLGGVTSSCVGSACGQTYYPLYQTAATVSTIQPDAAVQAAAVAFNAAVAAQAAAAVHSFSEPTRQQQCGDILAPLSTTAAGSSQSYCADDLIESGDVVGAVTTVYLDNPPHVSGTAPAPGPPPPPVPDSCSSQFHQVTVLAQPAITTTRLQEHSRIGMGTASANISTSYTSSSATDDVSAKITPASGIGQKQISNREEIGDSDDELDADRLIPTIGDIVNNGEDVLDDGFQNKLNISSATAHLLLLPTFNSNGDVADDESQRTKFIQESAAALPPLDIAQEINVHTSEQPNAIYCGYSDSHKTTCAITTEHPVSGTNTNNVSTSRSGKKVNLDLTEALKHLNVDMSEVSDVEGYFIIEDADTGRKRWHCVICGEKTYSSKNNLIGHLMAHAGLKPYKCDMCSKGFLQISHLNAHKLIHSGNKPYNCGTCNKSFTQVSHLRRHESIHISNKPYKCEQCKRGFTYPSELKHHVRKHDTPCSGKGVKKSSNSRLLLTTKLTSHDGNSKDKFHSCQLCPKQFMYPSQLKDHMLVHSDLREYSCNQCKASFNKFHHLKYHLATHNTEKEYKCSHCDKRFSLKANMQRHLNLHTGIRAWICHICDKSFTQHQTLRAHMIVHTERKNFACDICGRRFGRSINLKSHMTLHERRKPYSCTKCTATFTMKGNLVRHLKVKHRMLVKTHKMGRPNSENSNIKNIITNHEMNEAENINANVIDYNLPLVKSDCVIPKKKLVQQIKVSGGKLIELWESGTAGISEPQQQQQYVSSAATMLRPVKKRFRNDSDT